MRLATNPLHALSYRGPSTGPANDCDSNSRSTPNSLIRALLLFLSIFALALTPVAAQESYSYQPLSQMTIGNPSFDGYTAPLTAASNGMFYGVSAGYGSQQAGYIYMVDTFGNTTDILDFNSTDATAGLAFPAGNLIQGPDGYLYGITLVSASGWGSFYKVWVDGTNFQVLNIFDGSTDGGAPLTGMTLGNDGNFYAIGNSVFWSDSTSSRGHNPLHSASKAADSSLGPQKKGALHHFLPGLPLRRSAAIAGPSKSHAHPDGGPSGCNDYPSAAFYQITPTGTVNLLYCDDPGTGLDESSGPLVETADGAFWGMVPNSSTLAGPALFEITTSTAPNYIAATPSGDFPIGGLTAGTDGNFYMDYGSYEGVGACEGDFASGVMEAQLSDVITFSTTPTSCGYANGMFGGLYLATDGGLYGVSPGDDNLDTGSVVRYDIGEATLSYPHQFVNGYGANPIISPLQAADGNFYGITADVGSCECDTNQVFYSLDATPNMAAPIVLTTSDPTPPALTPMTLSWQVNNASALAPPVCIALINNENFDGGGGWAGIVTGSFSGNVYSGVTDVIAPPWPGTYEYQLVCNGQGSVQTQITVPYVYPTTTTVSGSSNISVGQTTTFTANVQVNYNINDPTVMPKNGKSGASPKYNNNRPTMTGNVVFTFNSVVLGRVRVTNGQASISMATTTLPYGTYTIEAAYSGDTNYHASSTSNPYTVAGAPTNISISTSVVTVDIGSPITLTASISNGNGNVAAPSGTFTFLADNNPIGTVAIVSGSATLSPSTAAVLAGIHQYSVNYNGDALHSTNAAVPVAVNVLKNSTRTNLAVGTSPVVRGQSETLTATVVSAYLVPTGSVCFFAGNTSIGCAPLVSGVASFSASTAGVKASTYPVHAEYMSDLVHNISKSHVQAITVESNQP